MTILARVFASAGTEVVIPTIEITCDAWSQPLLLCNGFENQVATTEDDRTVTFIACGMDVALPKRNTQGTQILTFAIDNVSGEAQQLIDQALDSGEMVYLTFRHYVSTDMTEPAEPPIKFVVRDGIMEGASIRINAAFFDLISTAWPRNYYTADFAPGLKYFVR